MGCDRRTRRPYCFSMTTSKQIQMVMRDMLFVTWVVEPDIARKLVDERLELDTKTGSDGREVAFVSAVCFHVTDLRWSALPMPNLTFQQVNYRVYVNAGGVPAVYFLEMKVNSRMVTTLTSFLSVPVHYEDIDITTVPRADASLGYEVRSSGIRAEAVIREGDVETASEGQVSPQFITQRYIGYARAGNGMFRIDVQQSGLDSVLARVHNVKAPGLERLGLLTPDQGAKPYSALYVREGLFAADMPVREW